jgi:hypothetical protein
MTESHGQAPPTRESTAGTVSSSSHAGGADAERTALKEWAVAVEALARGALIALVRKGGIREHRAGFAVRHDRFLLYPTYFHENSAELAPTLRAAWPATPAAVGTVHVTHVARVAQVWHVESLDRLRGIDGEHPLAWPAVESRFSYRGIPGVHVVAVRVARLRVAADMVELPRYRGCVSWVELGEDVDVTDAIPVLTDGEFDRRVATLASHLEGASSA